MTDAQVRRGEKKHLSLYVAQLRVLRGRRASPPKATIPYGKRDCGDFVLSRVITQRATRPDASRTRESALARVGMHRGTPFAHRGSTWHNEPNARAPQRTAMPHDKRHRAAWPRPRAVRPTVTPM